MALYDISGNTISFGSGTVDNPLLYNFTRWNGKILVTEGNSLTASNNWGQYLAEFLGMTHYNCAQSGGAIVKNDITKGYTMADIKANISDNYPENADLVILQGDTNIGMDGDPSDQMDNAENPKDTWTARMNYMIRCLRAKYHNVVIVLMPDSVRCDGDVPGYELAKNHDGYEAMRALAEYNRLAFFDFDHATPFNPRYADNYYTRTGDPGMSHTIEVHGQDYVHPSVVSYTKSKGYALAQFVAGLVFDPNAPNTAADGWSEQYTVTYTLGDGVTSSNTEANFWANVIYQTTLTGATTVAVTMDGTDITANVYTESSGLVRIPAITGDVVITATA